MTKLERLLGSYAAFHRDPRNIATHAVGIPLIVFAVLTALSRPVVASAARLPVTPALVVAVLAAAYYLRLDRALGVAMTAALAAGVSAATALATISTTAWLLGGFGGFVLGWAIQFVGHGYEGRKPAFLDDLASLAVGPLFVMAELVFALGFAHELEAAIERQAGPRRKRGSSAVAGRAN